jgi:polyphosphate glucokinase
LGEPFIGVNLAEEIGRRCALNAWVINDADAAGSAEVRFGAGHGHDGVVLMLTVGTGIGCTLFTRGKIVPNCEWGHICLPGGIDDAEKWASDAARKNFDLTWEEWMQRLKTYISYVEDMFWPDLIVIGGGLAKKLEKNGIPFETRTKTVPAQLLNEAGIIGAAVSAKKLLK